MNFKEEQIKESFQRIKDDISFLNQETSSLRQELNQTHNQMKDICDILEDLAIKINEIQEKIPREIPTQPVLIKTFPTDNPTDNYSLKAPKGQFLPFSTGNEGVPTDRQTNQQTDNIRQNVFNLPERPNKSTSKTAIEDAARILDSLDVLKKEIRIKFKQLTEQEILVFSTLYQLEEELEVVDYKTLAIKLNLTESSIRDYIGRLLKKGIPVDKKKINNKQIQLSISPNLKKIASLATILKLREI
jgi:hypothetical protein